MRPQVPPARLSGRRPPRDRDAARAQDRPSRTTRACRATRACRTCRASARCSAARGAAASRATDVGSPACARKLRRRPARVHPVRVVRSGRAVRVPREIPARVSPKDEANACTLFSPRVQVERETGSTPAAGHVGAKRRSTTCSSSEGVVHARFTSVADPRSPRPAAPCRGLPRGTRNRCPDAPPCRCRSDVIDAAGTPASSS